MSTVIDSLSPTVVAAVVVGLACLVITFIVHLISRIRRLLTAAAVMAISGGVGGGAFGPHLLQTLHLTH